MPALPAPLSSPPLHALWALLCLGALGGVSGCNCGVRCEPGFAPQKGVCVEIDACATQAGCDRNATCANTEDGFTCTCAAGFAGDGKTCVDADECASGSSNCHPSATCTNIEGGFTCACAAGFAGDGGVCADVDECAAATAGCDVKATCSNTDGGFSCTCPRGFSGDGKSCTDIDECATATHDCSPQATCMNTPGSFACACSPNFHGPGFGASGCVADRPALAAGNGHTCALLMTGAVKCWGRNSSGQLGLGDTNNRGDGPNEMGASLPAVNLGTGRTAKLLAAGDEHTCAILDNGSVKCWGVGNFGQLGLGATDNRGDAANEMANLPTVSLGAGRTAKAITAGFQHTCAILDNGSVKCWGGSLDGALGLGTTRFRGGAPNEMGDNLQPVDLGAGRKALALVTGHMHNCALLDDRSIKCWGNNEVGQLGLGDTMHRGANAGEMGDSLPAVSLGTGRVARGLTAGSGRTCALLDDSSVKCWGGNAFGMLGLGSRSTTGRGASSMEMGDNLPPVSLGNGRKALTVEAGYWHTCARLDNGALKCWGANRDGQLGLGDDEHRGDGPSEMGDNLPGVALGTGRTVTALEPGYLHTCAILDNGSIKCWGANRSGQLGLGDVATRGDDLNEMGDALGAVTP